VTGTVFLGLHLTSTLWALLFVNALFAYSAYPVIALGRMNLAFMAFAGVGGYTAAILNQKHGVDPALGIGAGVVLSSLLALPVGAVLARVRGIYVAIASVNLVAAFQITASGLPSLTGGALGLPNLPLVATGGVLGGALAGVAVLVLLFQRSRIGMAVRLQRSDPLLALASGVDTARATAGLFVLSAALGALAGSLQTFWYGFINPDFYSFQYLLLVLAMVVVGGTGSWLGPLAGAAFFTIVPEWLRSTGAFTNVFVGGILLLVVIFAPEGIAGVVSSRVRLWRARASGESRARRVLADPSNTAASG
jgi:branched-chain amino acid transport system permease protein